MKTIADRHEWLTRLMSYATSGDFPGRASDDIRLAVGEIFHLDAQVACYAASRSFWPLGFREALADGNVAAIKTETERAEAQRKAWHEELHQLREKTKRQGVQVEALTKGVLSVADTLEQHGRVSEATNIRLTVALLAEVSR